MARTTFSNAITLALSIALLGGCAGGSDDPEQSDGAEALEIDPAHQGCTNADECIMAMTQCSCHCGEPINEAHWSVYVDAYELMCEDYEGPWCRMMCEEVLDCVEGVCAVVASE